MFHTQFTTLKPVNVIRSLFSSLFTPAPTAIAPKVEEEDRARYRPGGYHPVLLGDVYADKYQVKRKLGFGLCSTVWLAEDVRFVLMDSERYLF